MGIFVVLTGTGGAKRAVALHGHGWCEESRGFLELFMDTGGKHFGAVVVGRCGRIARRTARRLFATSFEPSAWDVTSVCVHGT